MSVEKTLSNLNGKRVVKRVTGVHTVETVDAFRQELVDAIEENKDRLESCGLSIAMFEDDGYKFTLGAHYWLKPKLRAEQYGILTVRSRDYYFTPEGTTDNVYGDKKGLTYNTDLTKVEKPLVLGYGDNRVGLLSFELV
jgi:hypothetical protein